MDGSCCSFAVIVDCTDGMSVPLTLRFSTAPPKPALTPAQRDSSATLPWSWMTQTTFCAPSDGQPLARGLAGDLFVLAEVRLYAQRLPGVDARVEGDDRDARRDRRFTARPALRAWPT